MIKIIIVALVFAVIISYLKASGSDLYVLALVGAGIILFSLAFEYLVETVDFVRQLIDKTGVDQEFYRIIFKITIIGYLIEFSADTITDLGFKSLADKLVFVGKFIIFSVSLPILYAVFNLLTGLAS
ncbi:MAG: hypothetical protein E7340_03105 [Clostridiales bacterium]|nr:hypothetical protein [Clostridiales bacterium]